MGAISCKDGSEPIFVLDHVCDDHYYGKEDITMQKNRLTGFCFGDVR